MQGMIMIPNTSVLSISFRQYSTSANIFSDFFYCITFGVQPEALSNACMTIVYSPQTAETTQIMNYFQVQNQARTSQVLKIEDNIWDDLSRVPKDNMGIVPMPSDKFIYDYALAHPDTIQLGMHHFMTNEDCIWWLFISKY